MVEEIKCLYIYFGRRGVFNADIATKTSLDFFFVSRLSLTVCLMPVLSQERGGSTMIIERVFLIILLFMVLDPKRGTKEEKMIANCLICGIVSKKTSLTLYANLDCSIVLFLCHSCETKVLKVAGGVIPLESLSKLGGGGMIEERETECCGNSTKEQLNLCGGLSVLSEL